MQVYETTIQVKSIKSREKLENTKFVIIQNKEYISISEKKINFKLLVHCEHPTSY